MLTDDAMYAGSHVHCVVNGPCKSDLSPRWPIAGNGDECAEEEVSAMAAAAQQRAENAVDNAMKDQRIA